MPASTPDRTELGRRRGQRLLTQERIGTAAAQLVVEVGAAGTTFTEVARRAGVSEATVYLHYPNKEALLSAAVDRSQPFLVFLDDVAARPADEHPLHSIVHGLLERSTEVTTEEYEQQSALDQAVADDPLLTGIVHRSRELLTIRTAEALQRRPGAPVTWEIALLWSCTFQAVCETAEHLQRPDWGPTEFAQQIARLCDVLVRPAADGTAR